DKGIVAGIGNGKFNPNGELTAEAFGKMLLVAYGKAKAEDLTGAEWAENTRKILTETKLSDGVEVDDLPAPRENACYLAYNFMRDVEKAEIEKQLTDEYREVTINFNDKNTGKYRLLGRALQERDSIRLNQSADGVEFTADCGGQVYLTASVKREYWRNHLRLRVIVDGVLTDGVQFEESNGEAVTLVSPALIKPGVHTIKILKDTIGYTAIENLISVTIRAKDGTIAATQERPKLLELIGASTATGAGILPTPKDGQSKGTNNTASIARAFGYLTAEALNMDLRTCVKGSLGIVVKSGGFNLPQLYEYQNRFRDNQSIKDEERTKEPDRYDFKRKADIVLLMINENDKTVPSEQWTIATRLFINRIREINGPDCKILFLYYRGSKQTEGIKKILADDPDLISLAIRANNSGSGGHANAAAHRGWADQILPLLKPYV
ncbi:MAG: hypothetical protein IKC04_08900, partial [Oscillospiraceae bacterium]|nr:hypothetical protein [Oscillospiraceae bacterium]